MWDQHLKISDQQPEAVAYFGQGVAIDGQTIGIGAHEADVGVVGGKVVFGTVD